MKNFDFCLILTCTINPTNMPDLVRNDPQIRLNDYKESFKFWAYNPHINKIVMIENSNSDLSYFINISKDLDSKEIEILSSNSNNTFEKKLGKGYGQYLCFKEAFETSKIIKKTSYFINVTGRYKIKNFNKILNDICRNKTDIYININDNFKYANTTIFGGTKKFFTKYILPETSKTNDSINKIFENCVANATLKAISDGMTISETPIYADIEGYIGTNGKKYKQNIFQKIKFFLFRKLKIFLLLHKKY